MAATKAAFGLGNPPDRYARTRHNIGAEAVLAFLDRVHWRGQPQAVGLAQVYPLNGHLAALPQTFMNLSGIAVKDVVAHFGLALARCLIVYDDVSLPFGHLRLREAGGAGGHNGMASVLEHLGSREVPRLRIGIGDHPPPGGLADFVLGPFTPEERAHLPAVLGRAAQAIECFLAHDLETAMNRFNGPAL